MLLVVVLLAFVVPSPAVTITDVITKTIVRFVGVVASISDDPCGYAGDDGYIDAAMVVAVAPLAVQVVLLLLMLRWMYCVVTKVVVPSAVDAEVGNASFIVVVVAASTVVVVCVLLSKCCSKWQPTNNTHRTTTSRQQTTTTTPPTHGNCQNQWENAKLQSK